jgi:hypothetical protein
VVDGLHCALAKEKRENGFHGIRMGRSINLTHLLFMDGILIFCSYVDSNGNSLKDTLKPFSEVVGMVINVGKSTIYLMDS